MKQQELIRRSIFLITKYYQGEYQPFFDAVANNVLWLGPRREQILQGKQAIISTWTETKTQLQFTLGNIKATSVRVGRHSMEVLLEYRVYTHFPSGEIDEHHQRLHYSWGWYEKDENGNQIPKVYMIHISNAAEALHTANADSEKVRVFANSLSESKADSVKTTIMPNVPYRTVYGKGLDGQLYCFNSAIILWIESADHSLHSVIHTLEGAYPSTEKLRYYEKEFSDVLLRAHVSYLVNPLFVRYVKRFSVAMSDGTTLPIPEKKYTAFCKQLEQWTWNDHCPPRQKF